MISGAGGPTPADAAASPPGATVADAPGDHARGLGRDLAVLAAGQGAAQLLNMAALVVAARVLGDHWFGVVQVAGAVGAYALLTAEWGLFSLGVRDLARLAPGDAAGARALVARRRGQMLLLAVAVGALGWAVLPRLAVARLDPRIFLLYLAAVLPQALMTDWVALGLRRPAWAASARTVRSLVAALLVGLLLIGSERVLGMPPQLWVPTAWLLGFAAGDAVAAVGAARLAVGVFATRLPRPAELKTDLAAGAPIAGANLVRRVLYNIDLVLLGLLATPSEAGRYAAAAKLAFVLVTFTESSLGAALPRLAALRRDAGPAGYRRAVRRVALRVGLVLAPVAAAGALLGGPLVRLLYGEGFAGTGRIFAVLCAGYACLALALVLHESLVADDRQAEGLPPLLIGAALAAAATALLAHGRGAEGAAWGMATAHATYLLLVGLRALKSPRRAAA